MTGIIKLWRGWLREDRHVYETMTKVEAEAILKAAKEAGLEGVSVLNDQLTKAEIHEILSAGVRANSKPKLHREIARNVVREFVLGRIRI